MVFDMDEFVKESNLIEGYSGEPYFTQHMTAYAFLCLEGVTARSIRECHQLLMKNLLRKEWTGTWRTLQVTVGGHECPKYYKIPDLIKIMLDMPRETTKDIFDIHYMFECIHPFVDGNGRTGRCILNALLPESERVIIYADRRFEYYGNINDFRRNKFGKLTHGTVEA